MMNRRRFLRTVSASLLAAPLGAEPQQSGRVYRLGVLGVGRRPTNEALAQGPIASKLRELGWEEGRNLSIDYRFTESLDALPQLSASLVASKPDVLIALGPYQAHALKDASQAIPIVFAAVFDPVGRGLVSSLARPGGNVTGVSHYGGPGMGGGKTTELLKELVPRAQRIAWLFNPANTVYRPGVLERNSDQVSQELKVSVQRIGARSAADLPAAFEVAMRVRAEGLVVAADSVFGSERDIIVKLAEKHKLPTVYPSRGYVNVGGLISYGADIGDVYRRAAGYVDKILRGAKPADLPIEQPTKFELVINMKSSAT